VKARFETREADWLSVRLARDRIMAEVHPLPGEQVRLEEAPGRVLAQDLQARVTLPPRDNSAMDGYAVRGVDVEGAGPDRPVVLRVTGSVTAGGEPGPEVREGTAVRIMTGAPVPPGADTVIRVEDTDAEEGEESRVRVSSDRDLGRHIRPAGEDVKVGEPLLGRATEIGSAQIGALAAQGYLELPVYRRPRVGILPTGDELVSPGELHRIEEGGIPESNGPSLAAAVREAGGEPRLLPAAEDRREAILRSLEHLRGCDLAVTTGGASMGEADLLKRVLDEEAFRLDFWRVRIRPGSPFSYGVLPGPEGELPLFGLPGNPTSAFVTFEVFVRPYLLARGGRTRIHRPTLRARAGERIGSPARLTHFFRVKLEGPREDPVARLSGPQGSGLLTPLARCDGLAVVPEGVEEVEAGEPLEVILLWSGPGGRSDPGFSAG